MSNSLDHFIKNWSKCHTMLNLIQNPSRQRPDSRDQENENILKNMTRTMWRLDRLSKDSFSQIACASSVHLFNMKRNCKGLNFLDSPLHSVLCAVHITWLFTLYIYMSISRSLEYTVVFNNIEHILLQTSTLNNCNIYYMLSSPMMLQSENIWLRFTWPRIQTSVQLPSIGSVLGFE